MFIDINKMLIGMVIYISYSGFKGQRAYSNRATCSDFSEGQSPVYG
jgi:hypothetical protein